MNNYGDEMKNKKSYFTVPLGKKDIKDIKKQKTESDISSGTNPINSINHKFLF